MKGEPFEDSNYNRERYAPKLVEILEYLGIENQIDLSCSARIIHDDKVWEWLNLVENYFEFMGAIEYVLVELANKIVNVAAIGRDFKFLKEPFTNNSCALVWNLFCVSSYINIPA